jgi:hypothetical protein
MRLKIQPKYRMIAVVVELETGQLKIVTVIDTSKVEKYL